MRLSKLVFLALVASIPFTASATTLSSTVPLTGGSVAPGDVLTISGESLYDGVEYTASCILRISQSDIPESHVQVGDEHGSAEFYVNGQSLSANGQAMIEPGYDAELVVTNFRDYDTFTIRNLDRDQVLQVVNCSAHPSNS